MLFKVILNEDKWKVEVEMSGSKVIKRESSNVRVAVSVQSSEMEWQYHKRK